MVRQFTSGLSDMQKSLISGNGSGSNASATAQANMPKDSITRPDGTYTIGNSPNRLARVYMTPTVENGMMTAWRIETVDAPRIIAAIREMIPVIEADIDDEPNLPLHQRPVELECGLTMRITEKLTWHGDKYSMILRLNDAELPRPAATGGAKVEGKGKVKRGDFITIEHIGLVDALNDMATAAEARGISKGE